MRIIKPSPLLKVLALVLFLASQANGFPLSPGSEPVKKALGYFKASQQDDGGFGQGGTTEWVMIAIAAAGQDPRTWYRNGKTRSITSRRGRQLKTRTNGYGLS